MKSIRIFLSLSFFVLLLVEVAFAQKKNPTVYPYGGTPDPNRKESWLQKVPLNLKRANFISAHFDSITNFILAQFKSGADFSFAQFKSEADFSGAKFHSSPYFKGVQFKGEASFWAARFKGGASFGDARFKGRASFGDAKFDNAVSFRYVQFNSLADFWCVQFDSLANFSGAQFDWQANFGIADFKSLANFDTVNFKSDARFEQAHFKSLTNFRETQFDSLADFSEAKFDSLADFGGAQLPKEFILTSATFNGGLNFRYAELDTVVDFHLATFKDTLFVGTPKSDKVQKIDLRRAYLLPAGKDITPADTLKKIREQTFSYPGARILLFGPVELNMQAEKIEFLALSDTLDYYAKKDIISHLKETSFKDPQFSNARFELDYLFAKSTIYQKQIVRFEEYSWYHPVVWAQWLYKATMGLGYRPFRLLYWVAAINILFAVLYIVFMPKQINGYVDANFGGDKSAKSGKASAPAFTDVFFNAFYFSFMLFFTFRLKGNILTFFNTKEKRVVVLHWLLGFMVYISFLAFSKAGSVLHTLKSLFVG